MTGLLELLTSSSHWLIMLAVLVAASAFFSSSETALFFLSHDDLRRFRLGNAGERLAAKLLQDPDRLLTAILFWNLIINLLYFAITVIVTHKLADAGHPTLAGAFSLFGLFFIILLGEVLPKSAAVVFGRMMSRVQSLPLSLAVRLLDPVLPRLGQLTKVARRTFWPKLQREPHLEAADLERLVEVAEQSEEVVQQERQVLHNILDLSEIHAEEVMRPRGTYVTMTPPVHLADLKGEVPPGEYVALLKEGTEDVTSAIGVSGFTMFPKRHLEQAAELAPSIPWCATLAYALSQMRKRLTGVASVVNEYGETIGIVLEEDILDTVLSAQPSRARRLLQREPVLQVADNCFHVDGITTLRYLCKRLHRDYEPSPEGLVTVAGLVYDELGHLPETGDECTWQGCTLRVFAVDARGRLRVALSVRDPDSSTPSKPAEG